MRHVIVNLGNTAAVPEEKSKAPLSPPLKVEKRDGIHHNRVQSAVINSKIMQNRAAATSVSSMS